MAAPSDPVASRELAAAATLREPWAPLQSYLAGLVKHISRMANLLIPSQASGDTLMACFAELVTELAPAVLAYFVALAEHRMASASGNATLNQQAACLLYVLGAKVEAPKTLGAMFARAFALVPLPPLLGQPQPLLQSTPEQRGIVRITLEALSACAAAQQAAGLDPRAAFDPLSSECLSVLLAYAPPAVDEVAAFIERKVLGRNNRDHKRGTLIVLLSQRFPDELRCTITARSINNSTRARNAGGAEARRKIRAYLVARKAYALGAYTRPLDVFDVFAGKLRVAGATVAPGHVHDFLLKLAAFCCTGESASVLADLAEERDKVRL